MYKYLPITFNVQELMVMMKSLPVCTTIFDKNGRLIDFNQPSKNFLNIKMLGDFRTKRLTVLNDYNYLVSIIHELKTGKIFKNKLYQVKYPDSNSVVVCFSACMLNGLSDIFLFQFFELSGSWDIHLPRQKQVGSKALQGTTRIRNRTQKLVMQKLFEEQTLNQRIFQSYLDKDQIDLLSKRFPVLSYIELIVCGLIAQNMSTEEIALLTAKTIDLIYSIKYRIRKKLNLKSCKELPQLLIEEHNIATLKLSCN